ncbi:hypothetical protein K2Q08_00975, partial [Patescibacteria group bacterium]|nr:hypothetical protein [Patescibacteria group bacterium]
MSTRDRSKNTENLRQAFRHEIHPQEYLFRVWVTAIIAGGFFAYFAAVKTGKFELAVLLPPGGVWTGHDPFGGLY